MESFLISSRQGRPAAGPFAVSGVMHAAVVLALFAAAIRPGVAPRISSAEPEVVWLNQSGPGGGGGGGGNRRPEPSRQVKMRGADRSTVPSSSPQRDRIEETPSMPIQLDVPVRALADSDLMVAGVLESGPDTTSQGPGRDGGAGSGARGGIGPDDGRGLNAGRDRGIGDGVYRIGNGVTPPVPLHQEKPQYTIEAMRSRVEGTVIIECVVQPHGRCTNLRIVRSLDQRFGLDEQALRAAAQWRFSPGTRLGQAVPVVVSIQLGFAIN